jgi:hypothetical protein
VTATRTDPWDETSRRLEPIELEPFYAPFLMSGGMGHERIAFDWVEVAGKTVTARCHLAGYYKSPWDFEFHLNAVTGMAMISQLAMVHGMVVCGVDRKDFEILMMDYQQTMPKLIRDPADIRLAMTIVQRTVAPAGWRQQHPRTFFKWTFTLNDGCWVGAASAAFPFGPRGEGLDLVRGANHETNHEKGP